MDLVRLLHTQSEIKFTQYIFNSFIFLISFPWKWGLKNFDDVYLFYGSRTIIGENDYRLIGSWLVVIPVSLIAFKLSAVECCFKIVGIYFILKSKPIELNLKN